KLLAGMGTPLKGKLMICDFSDMYFTTIDIYKRENCPACHGEAAIQKPREKLVWLCGRNTVNVNPEKPAKLNLESIHTKIRQNFKIRVKSSMAIVFTYKNYEITLFNGGRMLIKNIDNEEKALEIYREIAQKIGLNR
ncbi:MAG: hypothetical protein QXJ62_01040, partial [Nitrososphaeria archaeon]